MSLMHIIGYIAVFILGGLFYRPILTKIGLMKG